MKSYKISINMKFSRLHLTKILNAQWQKVNLLIQTQNKKQMLSCARRKLRIFPRTMENKLWNLLNKTKDLSKTSWTCSNQASATKISILSFRPRKEKWTKSQIWGECGLKTSIIPMLRNWGSSLSISWEDIRCTGFLTQG